MARSFLTAEWKNLVMLNYEVDPAELLPLVPSGVELDLWQDRALVSLVGFIFADTRLLSVPIPLHRTFEEVNLRFYVKRTVDGEVRRAVTFIKEIVPKRAVAVIARAGYNEPYESMPMRHRYGASMDSSLPKSLDYQWQLDGAWCGMSATIDGEGRIPPLDAEETFVTEHYWGYTRQRNGSTVEYRVEHPRWRVWKAATSSVSGDLSRLYGEYFAGVVAQTPRSAFVADGSAVSVGFPAKLRSAP